MRNLYFFCILLCFLGKVSAQKELSLYDAVLAPYIGLYPQTVEQLDWLKDVDKYRYTTDSSIVVKTPKNGTVDIVIEADSLYLTEGNIPVILFMDDNRVFYEVKEGVVLKHYRKSKQLLDSNTMFFKLPENAQNIEYYFGKTFKVAFTIENNIYILGPNEENLEVTSFEDQNIVSGQAIHRYEFGITKGLFWSPDGSKLAFYQKDETDVADYPLLDINETPGKLKSIKYPMAGQKSEYAKIGVYHLAVDSITYLKTYGKRDDYLTNLTWNPSSETIAVGQLNRGQDHLYWNQYNVSDGKYIQTLMYETDSAWVEPEYPLFYTPHKHNQFVYLSEREGYMSAYKFDVAEKKHTNITQLGEMTTKRIGKTTHFENAPYPITEALGFNTSGTHFYFMATGPDPKNNLGYRVNLANGIIQRITSNDGQHSVKVSPSGQYIIDSYSSLTIPQKVDLVDLDKTKDAVTTIFTADNPLKEYTLGITKFIKLLADDNTELHGRIILPYDFIDTTDNKYPVLVYVYGGPHAQLVKNEWLGGASLWMHWLANQGYIVFTLDGRGSANRGFEFEKVIHRALGKVEMLDQLKGVNYLKSLFYVDSTRMAVHGWSFGGFMTTSLMLKHPDVFTTGVAGGPVMDWKWYEIMYGERYMDTPEENPEGYKETSTLNIVKSLKGKLLTIHGTADDVVVMQHNLAFIQECIKQGVYTDFFPYPMHPHNVRGKDRVHLMTKVLTYIIENNR